MGKGQLLFRSTKLRYDKGDRVATHLRISSMVAEASTTDDKLRLIQIAKDIRLLGDCARGKASRPEQKLIQAFERVEALTMALEQEAHRYEIASAICGAISNVYVEGSI